MSEVQQNLENILTTYSSEIKEDLRGIKDILKTMQADIKLLENNDQLIPK